MTHRTSIQAFGRGECGHVQATCSCGWTGGEHQNYTDYPIVIASEEAIEHLRAARITESMTKAEGERT